MKKTIILILCCIGLAVSANAQTTRKKNGTTYTLYLGEWGPTSKYKTVILGAAPDDLPYSDPDSRCDNPSYSNKNLEKLAKDLNKKGLTVAIIHRQSLLERDHLKTVIDDLGLAYHVKIEDCIIGGVGYGYMSERDWSYMSQAAGYVFISGFIRYEDIKHIKRPIVERGCSVWGGGHPSGIPSEHHIAGWITPQLPMHLQEQSSRAISLCHNVRSSFSEEWIPSLSIDIFKLASTPTINTRDYIKIEKDLSTIERSIGSNKKDKNKISLDKVDIKVIKDSATTIPTKEIKLKSEKLRKM